MADGTKVRLRNTAGGARGVRDVGGNLVMIEPKAAATLTLSDRELEDAKATGYFELDGESGEPALGSMNKAELLETAEAEGVTVEDGATKADIVAAIEAKRGEA